MQHTHEDFSEYPEKTPSVKDVNVWLHPSGMIMTHDYSCPVCRENHAIISNGVMIPCRECEKEGFRIVKLKPSKLSWWYCWLHDIKDKVY